MRQGVTLAAQLNGRLWPLDALIVVEAANLLDHRHRDRQCLWAGLYEHGAGDLQADGELHGEDGALTGNRLDLDRAAQPRDGVAHDIEPDAAPALLGERLGGGDARLED